MLFLVVFDKVMLNKSMKYIEIMKYLVIALEGLCGHLTDWLIKFFFRVLE